MRIFGKAVLLITAVAMLHGVAPRPLHATLYPCPDCPPNGGGGCSSGPICCACLLDAFSAYRNCLDNCGGLACRQLCLSEYNAAVGACISECPDC